MKMLKMKQEYRLNEVEKHNCKTRRNHPLNGLQNYCNSYSSPNQLMYNTTVYFKLYYN